MPKRKTSPEAGAIHGPNQSRKRQNRSSDSQPDSPTQHELDSVKEPSIFVAANGAGEQHATGAGSSGDRPTQQHPSSLATEEPEATTPILTVDADTQQKSSTIAAPELADQEANTTATTTAAPQSLPQQHQHHQQRPDGPPPQWFCGWYGLPPTWYAYHSSNTSVTYVWHHDGWRPYRLVPWPTPGGMQFGPWDGRTGD